MTREDAMKVDRRRFIEGSAAMAVMGATGATAARGADDSNWADGDANAQAIMKLYDAAVEAKQEQLVIYGAYSAVYKPLWEIFHTRFPKTSIVGNPIAGAPLITKLDAEF